VIDPELSPAGITFAPELSNQSHKNKRVQPFLLSRSHALRGNTVKARYAVSHDPCTQLQIGHINTGHSASYTTFPRSAWERELSRGGEENLPMVKD